MKPLELTVDVSKVGQCGVSFEGQQMNARQLDDMLRKAKRGTHVKILDEAPDLPYRCVGGLIFAVQRAKLIPDFTFLAEPPMPAVNEPN